MKKRFQEIEEKIKDTLSEREEAQAKLMEYQQILKETQQSCEHAEEVVMNS